MLILFFILVFLKACTRKSSSYVLNCRRFTHDYAISLCKSKTKVTKPNLKRGIRPQGNFESMCPD